jgi:DNA-binding MarR family transcriptional regulator
VNPFVKELIEICRCFDIYEREAICCGTVTVQQCLILQELHDGARDITRLAAFAGVTNSAMTRLVDGLERRKWIRRNRSNEDRRRVEVELTEEGQKEAQRLRDLTEQAVGAVLERIPKNKRNQILESMRLIRQAMSATRIDRGALCRC